MVMMVCMCNIRSDCEPRGQEFEQGAERRFRDVGPSGSRSRQTGAYPVYPASQATIGGTHGGRTPNSGSQSYYLGHAAATDGRQSRAPETVGVVDVFSSSFSSLRPLLSPVHHLPGCSQLKAAPRTPQSPLIICIAVLEAPWLPHLPFVHAGHQHQLQ